MMQKFESTTLPSDQKTLVIRLEELAPFPSKLIEEQLNHVPHSAKVYYA